MPNWSFTIIKHQARMTLNLTLNEYCVLDYIFKTQTHPNYTVNGYCSTSIRKMVEYFGITKSNLSDMLIRLTKAGFLENNEDSTLRKVTPKFYDIAYLDDLEDVEEVNWRVPEKEGGVRNSDTYCPNFGQHYNNNIKGNRSEPEIFENSNSKTNDIIPDEPFSDNSYGNSRDLYETKEFLNYRFEVEKLLARIDKKLRQSILQTSMGREDFIFTFVKWCFDSGKTFNGTSGLDKLLDTHVKFLNEGGKEVLQPDTTEFEFKVERMIEWCAQNWHKTDASGTPYAKFLSLGDTYYQKEADALKTLLIRRKINFEDLDLIKSITARMYTPNFQYRWSTYLEGNDIVSDVQYLKELDKKLQKKLQ